MHTTITLAAAAEPTRGWGGPIALAVVTTLWLVGANLHERWMRTHPSPTPGEEPGVSDTPQARAGADTDDTDRDTDSDTGWWGRIVEVGGQRVRATRRPEPAVEDDEDDEDQADEETIEDVIDDLDRRGVPYVEMVPQLMSRYRISDSTAKRRIRAARESREEREQVS